MLALLFERPLILSLSVKPANTATKHTHTRTYPRECTQTQQSVAEVQSGPAAVTLFMVKI